MKTFELHLTVTQEHLDENQHVNNVRYLEWVQEISRAHWEALAPMEVQEKVFWVVRSHQLTYKKEAVLGDELLLKTYVKSFKGPFSIRIVEVYREDVLIHQSESNWCLIDRTTMKPAKLAAEFVSLFI